MLTDASSYSEMVKKNLRDDILCGVFKPGEKITAKQIADKYKVSSMPVRDAFNQLYGEGFLEKRETSGTHVIGPSIKFIRDIYGLISSIEIELAMQLLESPNHIKIVNCLTEIVAEMKKSDMYDASFLEYDNLFHKQFYIECNNVLIRNIADKYHEITTVITANFVRNSSANRIESQLRKSVSDQRHEEIIMALEKKEPVLLRDSILRHMEWAVMITAPNQG